MHYHAHDLRIFYRIHCVLHADNRTLWRTGLSQVTTHFQQICNVSHCPQGQAPLAHHSSRSSGSSLQPAISAGLPLSRGQADSSSKHARPTPDASKLPAHQDALKNSDHRGKELIAVWERPSAQARNVGATLTNCEGSMKPGLVASSPLSESWSHRSPFKPFSRSPQLYPTDPANEDSVDPQQQPLESSKANSPNTLHHLKGGDKAKLDHNQQESPPLPPDNASETLPRRHTGRFRDTFTAAPPILLSGGSSVQSAAQAVSESMSDSASTHRGQALPGAPGQHRSAIAVPGYEADSNASSQGASHASSPWAIEQPSAPMSSGRSGAHHTQPPRQTSPGRPQHERTRPQHRLRLVSGIASVSVA